MHLFFLCVWVGPSGVGVGTFLRQIFGLGDLPGGHVMRQDRWDRDFVMCPRGFTFPSFSTWVGLHALGGGNCFSVQECPPHLTNPYSYNNYTIIKTLDLLSFSLDPFFFQICCSNITPV